MPRGKALWIFYFANTPSEPWIPRTPDGQLFHCSYLTAKFYANQEGQRRDCWRATVDPHPL